MSRYNVNKVGAQAPEWDGADRTMTCISVYPDRGVRVLQVSQEFPWKLADDRLTICVPYYPYAVPLFYYLRSIAFADKLDQLLDMISQVTIYNIETEEAPGLVAEQRRIASEIIDDLFFLPGMFASTWKEFFRTSYLDDNIYPFFVDAARYAALGDNEYFDDPEFVEEVIEMDDTALLHSVEYMWLRKLSSEVMTSFRETVVPINCPIVIYPKG